MLQVLGCRYDPLVVIRIDTDQDPLVEWIAFRAISRDCGEVPKMAGDPSVIGTRLVIMLSPKAGLLSKQIYVYSDYWKVMHIETIQQTWDQTNNIQIT